VKAGARRQGGKLKFRCSVTCMVFCSQSLAAPLVSDKRDPLVHHGMVKASMGAALVKAMDAAQASFREFHLPILVVHGDADA
jgi:hypothetical protein